MKSLSHPNIINSKESFEIKNDDDTEFIVIIMEYCGNGDLCNFLIDNKVKDESMKKDIIQWILHAVKYIHDKEISHGDIKAENILIDSTFSAKLCDFGFARTKRLAGDESRCGTVYYCAPELFMYGEPFDTFKTDIYALGILLYSIDQLEFPFMEGDESSIIDQIKAGRFMFNERMNKQLLSLVKRCTAMDPSQRPDIDDILNDGYLLIENGSSIENPSELVQEVQFD